MDLRIETSDPNSIDIEEVVDLLEAAGYHVGLVDVVDRETGAVIKAVAA